MPPPVASRTSTVRSSASRSSSKPAASSSRRGRKVAISSTPKRPAFSTAAAPFGNGKDDIEQNRKCAAGHRGYRLSEEVDEGDQEQRQGNQAEAHGNLHATNIKIERNLKFTLAGARVTKNENSKPVHRKAPDDSKGVEVGEESDVTATDDDGKNLHENDDVDDAVARAVTRVWFLEGVG